jgi:hypothetical protein
MILDPEQFTDPGLLLAVPAGGIKSTVTFVVGEMDDKPLPVQVDLQ